jgi:hypothetical protein
MSDQGESLVIIDTRKVATNFTHTLTGVSAKIYRLCGEPCTESRIKAKLLVVDNTIDEAEISTCLQNLVDNKLVLSLSNCFLSLALVGNTPSLPDFVDSPSGFLKLEETL